MSLTLVTGRANSGKTGLLMNVLLEAGRRGEQGLLLLPTTADARRAEAELSQRMPFGVRVTTLSQWLREQWVLCGDGRQIVSATAREIALREVLGHEEPDESAQPGPSKGLVQLLAEGVRDMAPSQGPAHAGVPCIDHAVDRYRTYLEERGLIEESCVAWEIGKRLSRPETRYVLNRFSTLSEAHVHLLEELASISDVHLSLPWEKDFAPTSANDRCVARLADISAEHVHLGSTPTSHELEELEAALYMGVSVSSKGMVTLHAAIGSRGEADVAARVSRDSIEQGLKPERIAIVCPNGSKRIAHVEAALTGRGVPYSLDVRQRVVDTAYGRAFAALLGLALLTPGRENATELLMGPYSDVPEKRARLLEARWRRNRICDARTMLRDMGREDGRLAKVARAVLRLAGDEFDTQQARDWTTVAIELFSLAAERKGSLVRLGIEADAASTVTKTIEDISSAGSIVELKDVRRAIEGASIPLAGAEPSGAVQVIEGSRLGARRFDVVVALGLTSEEYAVRDEDSSRTDVRRAVGLGDHVSAADEQRLSFYELVSRPRQYLHLIRRAMDDDGTPIRPSPLWNEVLDVYGGESGADVAVVEHSASATGVETFAPVFSSGRRRQRADVIGTSFTMPSRGSLDSDQIRGFLGDEPVFSVTEVETYLQCPRRWFHSRVMSPRDLDSGIGARERGSFAHKLLAQFYERLADETGESCVRNDNLGRALALFDEVAEQTEAQAASPANAEEALVLRTGRLWARSMVEDDAACMRGFRVLEQEWSFGLDGTPLVVGSAALKGAIDRVDEADGVMVTDYKSSSQLVGWDSFGGKGLIQAVVYALAWENETGQAPIASVYRSLRSHDMRGYWRSDLVAVPPGRARAKDALGADDYRLLVAQTAESVSVATEGMRRGLIARRPLSPIICAQCPQRRICEAG